MRPLAIVLIVAMHACTSFAGNWEPIPNVDMNIPAYSYIVDFIMGFALEAFALVSGYVYAFQSVELGHRYEF